MSRRRILTSLAGLAAAALAVPAFAAAPTAQAPSSSPATAAAYTGSPGHETGHVLGLPDHYSGPCSELMSGGGPGPSCTNPYPDSAERSRVNQLWANGFTSLGQAAAFHTSK